jgi:predicted dehydrogenase
MSCPTWAAHEKVAAGTVGTPQLLRSLTRDPQLADPARIPPWTIFLETLIHDFDILRHLNPGAEPVEVCALADALIRPDFKDRGLLDTAVVTIRFDNGALATAEACFQAVYGYDVRAEVLGSAGMLTMGDLRRTSLTAYGPDGVTAECTTYDQHLFHDAYVAELADFADSVRTAAPPPSPARTRAPPCPSPSPPSSPSPRAALSASTSRPPLWREPQGGGPGLLSSGAQQRLDGAAFVHGPVALGGLLQGQRQVEDLARVDPAGQHAVDQVGQVGADRGRGRRAGRRGSRTVPRR